MANHIGITAMIHEADCGVNRAADIPGLPDARRFLVNILDNLVCVAINRLQML